MTIPWLMQVIVLPLLSLAAFSILIALLVAAQLRSNP